jgi:hypothetical protein
MGTISPIAEPPRLNVRERRDVNPWSGACATNLTAGIGHVISAVRGPPSQIANLKPQVDE